MLIQRQARGATPGPEASGLSQALDDLAALLVGQGQCDARGIERARRVAAETGQRLDAVLMHLGLATERGLDQAQASLLGLPVVPPARYPAAPVLPERLGARFLRQTRAVPLQEKEGRLAL